MGEDTANLEGILKDTYSKKRGWKKNLSDRVNYGTKKYKEAIDDAADDEPDAKTTEATGFKKAVKERG